MRQALSEGRYAYVLVNNRFERNAPMTVQGLSERLRAEVPWLHEFTEENGDMVYDARNGCMLRRHKNC